MNSSEPTTAVVLAAGRGTRMRSRRPKVLHEAAGRPLLAWVLDAARDAGCERVVVVVGHGADEVRGAFGEADVAWVVQEEQKGTGHALAQTAAEVGSNGRLLVLSGDVPLVRPATLAALGAAAERGWGAMAVADLEQPGSLGRVKAGPGGRLEAIVEVADADPETLAVRTINAGIYALPAAETFSYLERLEPHNAQGELYLTDALMAAARDGREIGLVEVDEPREALGVNSRADLAAAHRALLDRKAEELMAAGVTLLDPETAHIEPLVAVGADTVIHSSVRIVGQSAVGEGCEIHQGSWVKDSQLGDGTLVEPYSVLDGARVGQGCRVGPFARLRPGAELGDGAKVGNFVEVKNSSLGQGVKASHLSYLGDASVGDGANIGAGTITCNYDGYDKHRTEIGAGASIGSDTMLVAPVKVGEGAETGAGSVITDDVPDGALGVERSRQRNVPGWRERKKRRKEKKTER